jgi:BirA family biotin operon repressor/biotin-[acetyl-CoA-carboxylase] ligase
MTLKDSILSALESERGSALSGQELAERFGVSRNAVWKAVQTLRREGYDISSATNKGYCLSPDSDVLGAGAVSALLTDKTLPVYVFDSIDSTNNECKRRIAQGQERFLVLSDEQTNGRGRSGKAFFSPKGTGLYMSLAMKADMGFESAVGITAYAAVCVAKAVRTLTGLDCGIKWVNDVYLDGKKVCGILTEAVAGFESGLVENIVVGIGINLRPAAVPEGLENIVGFLNCGAVKNALSAAITNALLEYRGDDKSYMADYKRLSVVLGRQVSYVSMGEKRFGVAVDIDDGGGLVVETSEGRETLRGGEISLTGIEGIK